MNFLKRNFYFEAEEYTWSIDENPLIKWQSMQIYNAQSFFTMNDK